jgi:hypothetical protein
MTKGVPGRPADVEPLGNNSRLTELPAVICDTETITDPRLLTGRQIGSVRGRLPDALSCCYAYGSVWIGSRLSRGVAATVSCPRRPSGKTQRHATLAWESRLPLSDQCVRQRLSRSLTCADSSSMIAQYPRCAGSRQHNWQHSPAIAGDQADGDWSLPGFDIGVSR